MTTRVLLVEDSPTQAEAARAALEEGGYAVTMASTGDEALRVLAAEPVDVVVSDIMMPGAVDGYELCRRIKQGERHETPVMLLTSLADPLDIIRGLEAGADNFLTKPCEPAHLRERLGVLLATRRARTRVRVRAGVTVYFMGREFTITAEREQVLDLLVTTFEDAVRQNHELRKRETELSRSRETLAGLYEVAVGLNACTTEQEVVDAALERALRLPGVRAGWIALREGESGFRVAAVRNLPPALAAPGAMEGDCLCRRKLLAGELDHVTNVIECERLRHAVGDAQGLRHHASVPLHGGGRVLGVMNLVGEGGGLFTEDDLAVLYGVGNQIAFTVERARLWSRLEQLVEERTATLTDEIGERVRAQDALRESEERYRTLVNEVSDGFFVTNEAGVFTFASQALATIFGLADPSQLVGRHVADFVPPAMADELRTRILTDIEAGTPPPSETVPIVRPDGRQVFVEVRPTVIRGEGGPLGTRGVLRDVTDRVRAEEALRLSDSILRQIGNLVLVSDGEGRVQWASPSVHTMLGCETDAVLGDGWWELTCPDPEEREVLRDQAARRARTELPLAPEPYERWIGAPDETGRWILWTESRGPAGLLIGVGYDITERKRLEDQFHQAQKMEAVGRLAGGIAHDFNNVLATILATADLLLGDLPAESLVRPDIGEIRQAAQRASQLTRQLLVLSRKQVLQARPLDLNEIIFGMEGMLRRVLRENIEVDLKLAADLGTARVDAGHVEQVLMNLVVNARDAIPAAGKVTIETRNVDLDESYARAHAEVTPGRYVLLAVSDTGTGMDEGVMSHVFEPFFTTKGIGKGTGLGLATVHGIVRQNGGHVWAYSEVGRGSSFKIYFPQVSEPAERITAPPPPPSELPGGPETILVAEDDGALRAVTCQILRRLGYTVLEASSGDAALALARSHAGTIDLLLSDVVMPGTSAGALAREFASASPGTRILFMSGYTNDAIDSQRLLDAGLHFIEKPFDFATLSRKVRDVLDGG